MRLGSIRACGVEAGRDLAQRRRVRFPSGIVAREQMLANGQRERGAVEWVLEQQLRPQAKRAQRAGREFAHGHVLHDVLDERHVGEHAVGREQRLDRLVVGRSFEAAQDLQHAAEVQQQRAPCVSFFHGDVSGRVAGRMRGNGRPRPGAAGGCPAAGLTGAETPPARCDMSCRVARGVRCIQA
ncbi:hypothetical protein BURPS1710b_0327 [Burkholderia pseudomallei 1710b]|uniref:Uncharacterized protein n=1 Tax=Burkholderia pseudomallei (strain 1710b) TaxID=320372 RepID=Q3JXG0_BURP1|nr:hypothetical protein BURPS1710b_0327 [Burkholderia pseudomallei 1710b]